MPPQTASAGPGFFPLNDPSLPKPVVAATRSIFRILVRPAKPLEIPLSSFAEKHARWKEGSFSERLAAQALEACVKEKTAPCPIPFAAAGTAFLAQDARTLFTVRHNFEAAATVPDFILLDAAGQLIYDTRRSGAPARFRPVAAPRRELGAPDTPKAFDLAWVDLAVPISAAPLRFADLQAPGEELFIAGFPAPSRQRRSEHAAPDSDGVTMRISRGQRLTASAFLAGLLGRVPKGEDVIPFDRAFLFSDVDGVPGQSGAPVLNARGEAVGLFTSHHAHKGLEPSDRYFKAGAQALRAEWILRLAGRRP